MADPQIPDVLKQAEASWPVAARVAREVYELSPNALGPKLEYLAGRWGQRFWERAERLSCLAGQLGGNPATAIVEFTMEILRAQALFVETREYSHVDFEAARREVYDNPAVMEGYYLEGLLLSHAFWPIHFDMHDFFLEEFLGRVPDRGAGVEVGFGHGLYLLEVLSARPGTTARGFDISPYSLRYANRLLRAGGIDPARFDLSLADIRYPLEVADASFQWGIFAEILEHIPDPLASLRELRRTLAPGAPVFLTTVVDSNAMDHLFQFEDVDAIRRMIRKAGFDILVDKVMHVGDYGTRRGRDPSIDVALVAVPF